MSTATTTARTMDVIDRCVGTLHDLAAQSPADAAATIAALRACDTPAAQSMARLIDEVASARHGESAMRQARRR